MRRISASTSSRVTEGPNDHQRTIARLWSGGRANSRCTSATPGRAGGCAMAEAATRSETGRAALFTWLEIHLDAELDDARVAGGIVLAEEVAQRRRAPRRPRVVRDLDVVEGVEDGRARGARRRGEVRRPVHAHELRVVEDVEGLETELQVAPAATAERDVLEQRQVVVVDAGVAQVVPRIGSDVADAGHSEGGEVDGVGCCLRDHAHATAGQLG